MAIQLFTTNKNVSDENKDLSRKSLDKLMARTDIGFMATAKPSSQWEKSQKLGLDIRQNFDDLVVVGIGGSSLGARALSEIFFNQAGNHRLHFCDNVDVAAFDKMISSIRDLKKTAWLFISKSGSTLETLAAFDFAHQIYKRNGLQFLPKTFFITEFEKNPLFELATEHMRPILEIPKNIGGRYSVLTPVGMVPAAFMGLNIEDIRKGAESALNMKERVVSVTAHCLESFDRQEWITVFWHYSSLMRFFGSWIQQLWAESLAKTKDLDKKTAKRVSTPMAAIGACDQHSILQQVMEGAKDKLIIFVRIGTAESSTELLNETSFPQHKFLLNKGMGQILAAEAEATALALTQEDISNIVLHIPDLSERTVGFLFMFWELVVANLGEAMRINAFDQPGVELGKRLAKQILDPSKLS